MGKMAYQDPKHAANTMYYRAMAQLAISVALLLGGIGWVAGTANYLTSGNSTKQNLPFNEYCQELTTSTGVIALDPEGTCGQKTVEGSGGDLSIVPTIGVVFAGVSATMVLLSALRFHGVRTLHDRPVPRAIAKKVYRQRMLIREIEVNTNVAMCKGLKTVFT